MIGAHVFCGLGNQLFQYATARALSLKHKTDLFLELSLSSPEGTRKYSLDKFNIVAPPLRTSIKSIPWKFLKEASAMRFYPEVLNLPDNVFIHGYWQFEEYFRAYEKQIRRELTFKVPISEASWNWMRKIRDDPMPVSLHIRRGDYLGGRWHIVPLIFYERCVRILRNNFPEISLYIFSNDLGWCRKHLNFEVPMYFVDANDESHAYDDLVLMSLCRHHIIANSTFSWWGAWLDNRIGSLVFAPRRIFKDRNHYTDSRRLPARWIVFDD